MRETTSIGAHGWAVITASAETARARMADSQSPPREGSVISPTI